MAGSGLQAAAAPKWLWLTAASPKGWTMPGGEISQTRRGRGRDLRKETALPVYAVDKAVNAAAVLILRRFL